MNAERIGPYRIEVRLGAGGMGEVYKAYDERLDRWVALKLIAPDKSGDEVHRERLRREARASARLNHPAIVQIYDMVETDGADCIVMELVEGRSLAGLLREGPLELPQALALARDVLDGLVVAHSHGVVHRDLKTENVIVTAEGRAKVLDFGISKRLDMEETESSLTDHGAVLGTCRSMAPEQAGGEEVDHRSDLFSFGVLLYEMVTSHSPFHGPNPVVTLQRLCTQRQVPAREHNPKVPEALSDLIDHLLEKKPARRPQSAREVAAALARIVTEHHFTLSGTSPFAGESTSTINEMHPSPRHAPTAERMPQATAERRQVTILSCGLVRADGSPLDPEELLAGMPALQAAAAEAVQRFEGRLAAGRGHGCMVSFGDLQAHEDDVRRAVHTALEIGRRMGRPAGRGRPAVRIGIHTGPMVVTRATSTGDDLALGETPHVATLVQTLAGPGTVLMSQATHRLIEKFFECAELPPVALPGAGLDRLYRVVGDRGAGDARAAGTPTPLVGREQELGLLLERWALAKEGKGQVVLLGGEAGLGKSRLLAELRLRVAADAPRWLEGAGSPYHRNSAFHPILEALRHLLGDRDETPEGRLALLEETLVQHGLAVGETLPFLAALLSLPPSESHALPTMPPERLRKKTVEAVLSLLLALAERRPLLLTIEDLHWADPSTLELLGLLIDHSAASPLLLVLTFRPEFQPPWEQRSSLTRLTVGLLTRRQAGQMIERLTAGRQVAPALLAQIAARTDGVPLFIEEMTKMILDAAAATGGEIRETSGSRPSLDVPGTLEGWLRARLDRLGTAKEVAQFAAALGREFSDEVLRAASPWHEEILGRELDRLIEAELLYRRGLPPQVRYVFKHALLQDAAYASLLRSDRQRYHQQIAEVLEESFAQTVARQPEVVAHHYTEAGLPERAVPFWRRAGEQALQASAYPEALGHLERALALLAELPESEERDREEISIQVALGVAKAPARTYAAPEVRQAYSRAWELCRKAGRTLQLFPVLRGLYVYHLISGQVRTAVEMAEQLLAMAESEGSPDLQVVSHHSMGFALLTAGQFARARFHLEEALAVDDSASSGLDLALPGGGAPKLESLANLAWALWFLGYPDQAMRPAREAIELSRRLGAPLTLCYADAFAAALHAYRREPEQVLGPAEELLTLALEQGFEMMVDVGHFLRGWAVAELGDQEAGVAQMREGINGRLVTGTHAGLPTHMALLTEFHLRGGRIAEGLATLDEAFNVLGGQGVGNPEMQRLKGELLLAGGAQAEEVEPIFLNALEITRRQEAKSLELRSALALARLWAGQGRKAEARTLLAPVYDWFTEGHETRDLVAARELLDELAEGVSIVP